ncbi:MAG: hypothetical protein K9L76_00135 [Candidatus Omnitrophica bacterium]|nr:hypothetical protein [Candidatus Omnitrophota bacterium]
MPLIALIVGLIAVGWIITAIVGVGSTIISWSIVVLLIIGVGSIFFAMFGWKGIVVLLGISFIAGLIDTWIRGSKRKSAKKKYKKWQKKDEELEDYDYLDDMIGRDDKPWI